MPKAFTPTDKEWITRRLLEQGEKQFSVYGLRKTNVEEIALAVGISKGAFYNFYASKEALFMDVVEQVEVRVRAQILQMVAQPGPTPRSRLLAVLHKAFTLFNEIPILRVFNGSEFDLLFRRVPAEKLEEHFASDRVFAETLVAQCQAAGIPIQVEPGQMIGLLYPLVLAAFQQDQFHTHIDVLLELVAAYCLGEIDLEGLPHIQTKEGKNDPTH